MLNISGFHETFEEDQLTKYSDKDVNVFLSRFVFRYDSVSARVGSQAHRNAYNRGSVGSFHLKEHKFH